jgi:predicted DNA binding CopG/RHH family protein
MSHLTQEEMELLESFENDEWVSKANLEERKQELQAYARNTPKPVQILVPEGDLKAIKSMALKQGLSYNNLISNILHQYVADKLVRQA